MKIAIDARLYGLENAGLGRYVLKLVNEIAQKDRKNEYFLLLRKKHCEELVLPPNFHKILADYRHYSLAEQTKIPQILASIKPDLTHFPHFNVPVLYKGPYILTIHDMLMHKVHSRKSSTLIAPFYLTKKIAYRYVFKSAVKSIHCKKIIVPTNTVAKEIKAYYKIPDSKIKVIYEGVDNFIPVGKRSEEILKKHNLNTPYFIYTGNLYPHKNLERAINAIVRLNQHSKVQFAIISARNVFGERMGKLIKKYYATKYVKLLGFVPDDEMKVLYQKSSGFVFPSLAEGFGLPGLEAISAGTIALISDLEVFREVYGVNAVYFDPYRVQSIEDAMTKVLSLPGWKRKEVVKKGRKFIKKYSWKKMAKETLDVYKNVTYR